MAIIEITRRETTIPTTPRKAMASFFCLTKATSSFSSHLPRPTPFHTFSELMMEENIENAVAMITKWDPRGSSLVKFTSLFQGDRNEAKEFITCIMGLRRAMHFLISEHSSSGKLALVQNLMQMAMQRLNKELYQILSANKEHLKPESVSIWSSQLSQLHSTNTDAGSDSEIQKAGQSITEVERLAVVAMSDLRLIADCMISSGYGKECMTIYKVIRRSIVDEGLHRIGIEGYNSFQIKKLNPDALEHMTKTWVNAVKIVVKLLHGERFLCDHVFAASDTIKESCFTDITEGGAMNLFRLPELVAKGKRLPENVFQLMDLYKAISDLWPDIESIFSLESVSCVKLQAISSIHRLRDTVQAILFDFELSIQKNSSRMIIPGGGIHPLTNSVLNYVSLLANYSGILSDIIPGSASAVQLPFPESYFGSPPADETQPSAVSVRIASIILTLFCKLDSKAEFYNDIALSYLFLANNLQFVVEKVRTTSLKCLLGDDWLAKLGRKVKLYAANYESMAWTKVFSCLPENLQAAMETDTVKAHFRQFNTAFEEAYKKQMSWVVLDTKLRDDIKLSIAEKLVPAYGKFYGTYMATLSGERKLEALVRFSPDNLINYLSDLLHGTAVLASSSSSNSRASRCLP